MCNVFVLSIIKKIKFILLYKKYYKGKTTWPEPRLLCAVRQALFKTRFDNTTWIFRAQVFDRLRLLTEIIQSVATEKPTILFIY